MKVVPQEWFSNSYSSKWVDNPFNRLAWFLEDRKELIPDEVFDELIYLLDEIYNKEFFHLDKPEPRSLEEIKLLDKARENVHQRLLKEYENKRKKDPDYLPILEQEQEKQQLISVYDIGYNAIEINEMIKKEYNKLKEKNKKEKSKTKQKKEKQKGSKEKKKSDNTVTKTKKKTVI